MGCQVLFLRCTIDMCRRRNVCPKRTRLKKQKVQIMFSLAGKKGLIVGVANDQSIAWGCAKKLHEAGADLAITYLNEKAEKYVRPLAESVDASLIMQMDVTNQDQVDGVFYEISQHWGKLDFVIHSIAFAPMADLHGRFIDTSAAGFAQAMDISCHSLVRLARHAEPLMTDGGSILTTSYYGSEKVVPTYGIMGPVKAALECSAKYLAAELGPKGIRVSAMSPGPVKTRAASGIKDFNELIDKAQQSAPGTGLVTIEDIGAMAVFMVSDEARAITGSTAHIDGGYNIMGA